MKVTESSVGSGGLVFCFRTFLLLKELSWHVPAAAHQDEQYMELKSLNDRIRAIWSIMLLRGSIYGSPVRWSTIPILEFMPWLITNTRLSISEERKRINISRYFAIINQDRLPQNSPRDHRKPQKWTFQKVEMRLGTKIFDIDQKLVKICSL